MLAAALGSASPGISCVVADEPSSEQNQGMPLVPASLPNSEVPSALQAQQEQPELRDNAHEIEEYRVKLRALFERNLESGDLEKVVELIAGSASPEISCVVADEPSSEQNQGMPLVPALLPNSEVPSALQAQR